MNEELKVLITVQVEQDRVIVDSQCVGGEYDPNHPAVFIAEKIMSLYQNYANSVLTAFTGGHA